MKHRGVIIAALALAFLAVGWSEAHAQRTFMFVPGIEGDSLDEHHPNWIEIESLSQGAVSPTRKTVACGDVHVSKALDRSGPALWAAAALGQVFPQVHIEIVNTQGAVIYDIRLNNARVTSIQTSGSSFGLPSEGVAFAFQSLILQFNRQLPNGQIVPGTPQTITCQQ